MSSMAADYVLLENGPSRPHEAKKKRVRTTSFKANRQTFGIFLAQSWQLAVTALLCVLILVVLKIYTNKGTVTKAHKYAFNAVQITLTIALSLNFFEAFKNMAKIARWRLLATRSSTVRETELIMGSESLMKVAELALVSRMKPGIMFACIFWLFLNIIAQVAVAVSSLTYSWETGIDSTGIITGPGTVSAPRIDCYYNGAECLQTGADVVAGVNQTIGHAYGGTVAAIPPCPYKTDEDIYNANQNCLYFFNSATLEYAYRYKETNPEDLTHNYPYLTNRIVKTSSKNCFQYGVPNAGGPGITDSPDGDKDTYVYSVTNKTFTGLLAIPKIHTAHDATTYIYNGTNNPQSMDPTASCGKRCMRLYAYRGLGYNPYRESTMFSCEVSVSEVSNASVAEHNLPDDMARVAASSIALTGRYRGFKDRNGNDWRQFQLYSFGSYWELEKRDAKEVGARMAQFAIGSIATMAEVNPLRPLAGTLPVLGYNLSVHWPYIIAFAVCISAAHALIVALILWISRPVIITEDSYIVIAGLLHGVTGRIALNSNGSVLNDGGRKAVDVLQRSLDAEHELGKAMLKYGFGAGKGGATDWVLEIGRADEVAGMVGKKSV